MPPDPARDGYLRLIEARTDIGGRYGNLRRVGANGGDGHFSLVFSATDAETGQTVAIKIFRPDRLSDTYRFQSFCREAILLEELTNSPHILEWLGGREEFVEHAQTNSGIPLEFKFPYFVVELASTDVATMIRSGAWSAEQKLVAFRAMCKAVQRIHKRKIVHRDIKPANFLVMPDLSVKLSDFGTARKIDGNESSILASYAAAPGDKRYTSPEMHAVLHDEDPTIAIYGDIFGLGATLFELFSGVVLGIQIFDAAFAADLARAMGAVHRRDRQRIYLQFVQSLAAGHPLPSISAYGNAIPACIRQLLDTLYKSMAALNYQRREWDFETIFLKIDQCLLVLRNEEKVRRWQRQKEQYKQNHAAKLERRSRFQARRGA
jgi:serine/threonine protein kinase